MPERTVKMLFYNWTDDDAVGHSASRGEVIDISDAEAERGDSLGAFDESPEDAGGPSDALAAAYGTTGPDPESGVETAPPPPVADEAAEFPEEEESDEEPEQPDPTSEGYPDLAEGADEDTAGQPGSTLADQQAAGQAVPEAKPTRSRRGGGAAPAENATP